MQKKFSWKTCGRYASLGLLSVLVAVSISATSILIVGLSPPYSTPSNARQEIEMMEQALLAITLIQVLWLELGTIWVWRKTAMPIRWWTFILPAAPIGVYFGRYLFGEYLEWGIYLVSWLIVVWLMRQFQKNK